MDICLGLGQARAQIIVPNHLPKEYYLRQVEFGVFSLGLASFVAAAFFIGQETGDALWRIGVAAMLLDIVFMKLWPSTKP